MLRDIILETLAKYNKTHRVDGYNYVKEDYFVDIADEIVAKMEHKKTPPKRTEFIDFEDI